MENSLRIKDGFSGERAFVLPPAYVDALRRHPLSQILHITDIGCYPSAAGHYRRRVEPVGQYVFIYCVSGSGWYQVNGRRYDVHADSYFILPPDAPHSYGASGSDPWTIYWIHFNGTLASQYLLASVEPVVIKPGVKSRIADRLTIFEEIMSTLENGLDMENLLYACSVFHHFLGSLRFLSQFRQSNAAGSGPATKEFDPTEAAIHFMNENIGKKLRLRDLADYTGYSPTQFSAIFAAKTGVSPVAYFNRLKVEFACRLLDYTDLRVNQICHKVGISDPYYFSRLFSKETGVSPNEWRRRGLK